MEENQNYSLNVEPVVTEHAVVTHYLCSVMTEGMPTDPRSFASGMARVLGELGVVPVMSTAYMSKYGANPVELSLKDQWLKISGLERDDFMRDWPQIGRAIDMICGVTKRDLGGTNGKVDPSPS